MLKTCSDDASRGKSVAEDHEGHKNGFLISGFLEDQTALASCCDWKKFEGIAGSETSNPVSPDLSEVYSFLGDMVDPDKEYTTEIYLQKLKEMDPITSKTILQMMKNLTINLSSPDFEQLRKCLAAYDDKTQTVTHRGYSCN